MAGFTQNFKRQNYDSGFLPASIIDKMNKKWEGDLEYIYDGKSSYVLISKKQNQTIRIENFVIENLNEIEKKCGKSNLTMKELVNYSYNSQNPIVLIPKENFKQYFNDHEVGLDEMIKIEDDVIDFQNGKITLIPKKMDNTFKIRVGNGTTYYEYEFIQKPIESISKNYFVSSPNSKISIEYIVDDQNLKFNMRLNHKNVKNASEYLKLLEFMKSLFDNGMYFDEHIITEKGIKDENYDNRCELIEVWRKIVILEKKLGIVFSVEDDIITSKELFYIEALYKSLIENMPTKTTRKLKTISYNENELTDEMMEELKKSKNKSYCLEFSDLKEITILKTTFSIYELRTFFNIYISEIEDDKEINKKIVTIEENEKDKMFCSLHYFTDSETLLLFQNEENHNTIMYNAEKSRYFSNLIA